MEAAAPVPFERKTIFLKQVRASNLRPYEKVSLEFFFPGYHDGAGFEEAELGKHALLKSARESGFTVMQDKHRARRYAGDFTLPRGSYFTVCRDAEGDDGNLLFHELKAYSKPQDVGFVVFFDTTNPHPSGDRLRALIDPGTTAIFCLPGETPHFRSPFRQVFEFPDEESPIAATIPTELSTVTFDRLIDLRMPKTREWFVREFTRLRNEDPPVSVFSIAPPLDDFKDLLPTLLAQGLGGGTGATQIAGSWLRRLGADALIFPSARVDVSVSMSSGKLEDWFGWNLVDYRNAKAPMMETFIDISPQWDRYPTIFHANLTLGGNDDDPPPVEYSNVRIVSEESGPNAGTLTVTGVELVRAIYHDIALWKHYTDRMGPDLGGALLHLTYLAASDGKRGVIFDRVARIARAFMAALQGDPQAKKELVKIPSFPVVAAESNEYSARLRSFLGKCV